MHIALAQIDSTIGDFKANGQKIIEFSENAKNAGAELVLFPELSICAYPPMDLLDQDCFVELNIRTLRILQHKLPPEIAVGVGYVNRSRSTAGKALVNAYGIIYQNKLVFEQIKTLLPTYDVFDEARNFESANAWNYFAYKGQRIGIAICEDIWRETETPGTKYAEDPVRRLLDLGLTMLCAPSASPYYAGKQHARLSLARRIASRGEIPVAYINAVGANDSIIFDGRSFILDKDNTISAKAFEEDIIFCDIPESEKGGKSPPPLQPRFAGLALPPSAGGKEDEYENQAASEEEKILPAPRNAPPLSPSSSPVLSGEQDIIEEALVMGIRDYMRKCGFKTAHLGLSGGIDSALVAYLAVRAIGKENVVTIAMPSRFSSQNSNDDAAELARNLGCRHEVLPIEPVFTAFLSTLNGVFEGRPFDIAEENLQARIRGSLLMGFSNKWNSILLTTGNKSELAMGYCTLYGDMNGALAPIGDLFKTEVFALCREINKKSERGASNPVFAQLWGKPIIPPAIIEKAPSAELRPDQKDEDSLPPYELLDEILKLYLFKNLSVDEIVEQKYQNPLAALLSGAAAQDKNFRDLVSSIIKTVARAEFKRRQAPPVLKVSPRAFGMGRRMPIARAIYEG